MKSLILIRHAKSSWDFPQQDIDRPIETRGKSDATLVASACVPFLPETYSIYCSVARRTYETCLIFAKVFGFPEEDIIFSENLYTFDSHKLEMIVRSFPDTDDNVILFGHNEAITNFVNKFGNVFIDNVPTSGLISLQFNTNEWHEIGEGTTLKTIFPKDLK